MSIVDATLKMILLGENSSAVKALKGVGDETDHTSTKMEKFHKVGTAVGIALAGGLVLAAKAAEGMTKAATADQVSAASLAQSLHKAAGATDAQVASTEDWITKQGEAYGVAKNQLRPALSQLAIATGSVSKAQKLASLSMDIAAARGLSLKTVSLALAKAQTGSTAGLARLGVATKDAAGKTLSLHAITQKLTATYSGAAATAADTAAGKQKILAFQMEELQIKIGTLLIPALDKLLSIGLKVTDWVTNHTKLTGILVGVLGGMAAAIWAVSVATKAWAAVTKIAAAVQWALNAAMDANPVGLIVLGIAALVAALIIAYKKSAVFRSIVNGAFHAVGAAAQFVFNWIKGHWKLLAAIIGGPVVAAVILIISNWGKVKAATAAVWAAIKSIVKGAWQAITGTVKFEINTVLDLVRGAADGIMHLGGLFLNAGKSLIHNLFSGIMAAAQGGASFVSSLVRDIANGLDSVLNLPLVLPRFHVPGVGTIGGETLIPRLAKGGITNGPTLALIGDNPGGREAVVPLSGPNARGLGGDTYNFTFQGFVGDEGQVMAEVQKGLVRLKRRRGGVALGLS